MNILNRDDNINNMQKDNNISVDFIDDGDYYIIYADLCGVTKEDIDIEIKGQVLMINAKREFEIKNGFHSSGIKTGKLCKVVELKSDIDVEKTVAEYNNGLLKIIIPKVKNENAMKIEIK